MLTEKQMERLTGLAYQLQLTRDMWDIYNQLDIIRKRDEMYSDQRSLQEQKRLATDLLGGEATRFFQSDRVMEAEAKARKESLEISQRLIAERLDDTKELYKAYFNTEADEQ